MRRSRTPGSVVTTCQAWQRKQEGQKLRTMKLIRSIFEMADADHNGQLTLQEFRDALQDQEVVRNLNAVDIPRYHHSMEGRRNNVLARCGAQSTVLCTQSL